MMVAAIRRYVVLGEAEAVAVALWVVGVHGFEAWFVFPRLFVNSPEKGCGKSTFLRCLNGLERFQGGSVTIGEHKLTPENVEKIIIRLPEDGAKIVNNRSMPDVNCQHIIALALVEGTVRELGRLDGLVNMASVYGSKPFDQLSEAEVRIGYSTADGSSASAVGRSDS